jgi:signal transduction histidine kinase
VKSQGEGVTLTTRLSVFFLAALAVVLAGFSVSLYLLARAHLHQQVEERVEAALSTLAAVAEVGPEGIEWELAGRPLTLGQAALGEQIAWLVTDEQGQVIDRSRQPAGEELASRLPQATDGWQIGQRRLGPAEPTAARPSSATPQEEGRKYAALTITVGLSLEPVRSTLHHLAGVLGGLCLGVWLVALVAGRLVCRRALRPVTLMAAAAREMGPDDLGRRLPRTVSGDELEDLSRAFNGLLDRLQESVERERRFTSDASHQLRTPVATILGQIEVALRRERSPEEYRRVLALVQQRAGHLRRLVEALLFLARTGADARLPELERMRLNEWLHEHRQTWVDHPRAGDLRFICEGDGSDEIETHPVLLGELLNILLDNACKFSRPAMPIMVRIDHGPEAIRLSVIDQGCGIQEADLPLVFKPFFRSSDQSHAVDGLGLGLSIAKRLAEAFGGTLTVTSQVGQGSTFTLRLGATRESGVEKRSSFNPEPTATVGAPSPLAPG